MALMSAPEILSGLAMKSSKSTSSLRFILLVIVEKIKRFCLRSGRGNSILRSSRPGLSRAGSSVSALFVAIITLTLTVWSKPSIWFNNSSKILCTSLSAIFKILMIFNKFDIKKFYNWFKKKLKKFSKRIEVSFENKTKRWPLWIFFDIFYSKRKKAIISKLIIS